MAQTGFTPIQIYFSTTATNVPLNTNLANGELAINSADGKLFYKDSGGAVQTLASQNLLASQVANYVYASPNGSAGVPTFRALVSADIPSLSGTYIPYTGASSAVDLNAKTLVNVANLGVNTTTVPTIRFRAVGDNNSTSRIAMRGYSSDANSSAIRVSKFRGTSGAPQAPISGDSLGKFELAGYGTTSADAYPQVSLEGVTTEVWGATARGAKAVIKVTPNTTITQVTAVTVDQDSKVTLAGALAVTGTTTLATSLSGIAKLTSGVVSTATSTGTGSVVLDTLPTISIYANALTFQDNVDPTKIANFNLSALVTGTSYSYNLPAITGALASLGNVSQTFTGAFTVSPSTASSTINIGSASGTGQISIGRSTAAQTIVLGSATSGSSTIDIGRTRATLSVNIATGTNSSSPKTINIGTNSTGGTTYITIGEPNYESVTTLNGLMVQGVYTLATIPVPSLGYGGFVAGCRSFISDALAPVVGAIAVGGGAVNIPVYYNGTNWICDAGASGAVTSVTGSGNIASTGGATPNITFTGVLPIANGGTNATTAPAAGANIFGFTTTATATGTTTLTNTSTIFQLFTGTLGQIIVLPVTSTLTQGWTFNIVNNSTGSLTVNSSGGDLVTTIVTNASATITCILASGTTAASWTLSGSTTAVWGS